MFTPVVTYCNYSRSVYPWCLEQADYISLNLCWLIHRHFYSNIQVELTLLNLNSDRVSLIRCTRGMNACLKL